MLNRLSHVTTSQNHLQVYPFNSLNPKPQTKPYTPNSKPTTQELYPKLMDYVKVKLVNTGAHPRFGYFRVRVQADRFLCAYGLEYGCLFVTF